MKGEITLSITRISGACAEVSEEEWDKRSDDWDKAYAARKASWRWRCPECKDKVWARGVVCVACRLKKAAARMRKRHG